ncbi:MAG: hypothetical protein ACK5MY_17430 [Jhaorihella sp.]
MARLVLFVGLVLAWAGTVAAGDRSPLWPDIPAASGAPHPEGNAYWRANHMDLMRHDRNLTVHEGERKIAASLKQCFDCHTARDAKGQAVTYADKGHFCRSCHDFAAVRVDCFTCHRSTPEGVDETAAHAAAIPAVRLGGGEAGSILAWLKRPGTATPPEARQ